jgi:hypothetical protein
LSPNINDLHRAVGMATLALRIGPARADSKLYDALVALGVLQERPCSHPLSDVIAHLPWGPGPVPAPEPTPPSGIEGPWPQDPIMHPDFPPAVLNISREDRNDHVSKTVTRYFGQLMLETPAAAWRSRFGPRVEHVSDDEFESMLTHTSFAQFLLPIVAPREREAFADDLKGRPNALFGTIDYSAMADFRTLPGSYIAPTVVLLRQRDELDWAVVAIRCGQHVFHPDDDARWELAKYFVIQSMQHPGGRQSL